MYGAKRAGLYSFAGLRILLGGLHLGFSRTAGTREVCHRVSSHIGATGWDAVLCLIPPVCMHRTGLALHSLGPRKALLAESSPTQMCWLASLQRPIYVIVTEEEMLRAWSRPYRVGEQILGKSVLLTAAEA